ncbi:MAG: LuxR C-terminal-related transcriptional regulator [Treponema sp.]|nr:LuxR C-terminal-related transcriptional regulator [Treponema sp.]MCL2271849.1 LuxR C-terminal-related transcriptional regulator [Treponema sp.]
MEVTLKERRVSYASFHFERHRLNDLFLNAMNHPLVLVCAGAGYGKTTAVHDFVQEYQATTLWVQLSQRDNVDGRFWENFTHTMMQVNPSFAKAISKPGFPDTAEKLSQFNKLLHDYAEIKRRIIVFDDCHSIDNQAVIRFMESAFSDLPPGTSLLLISRSTPKINIASLVTKGQIFNVSEEDLRFTESEIAQYFRRLDISLQGEYPKDTWHPAGALHEIMQDTEGWAFAINIIAQSYKKAPGYTGYLRTAMKANIFRLMETEIWSDISERLQCFLVQLSLISHLSIELISLLAGADIDLITELDRQNAYVRRDSYIHAYLIHPLFLEFLAGKDKLLSEEQKIRTYKIAGEWCDKNGFKIDAISYYEKIADYQSIVKMFIDLPAQFPDDIARFASVVLDRVPEHVFDSVVYLASIHMRSFMCQGLWQRTVELAKYYEARFQKLPDSRFKTSSLASINYCWAISRTSMNLTENNCDFDIYYRKLDEYYPQPINPGNLIKVHSGPWVCAVGSAEKGAPQKFIEAYKRAASYLTRCFSGLLSGVRELTSGEFKFYQGEISEAETYIAHALDISKEKKQYEIIHRALLYTLRIAVLQGDYKRAEQARREEYAYLSEADYTNRFTNYDIFLAWYYYLLDVPEKIPEWIQENFTPYRYASFIENFANQAKGRFFYMARNYPPLLSYIQEMKNRESYLFGRVEMLAIEACIHYKMKNRKEACETLREAYETAVPNDILMPFIELGKDMRTMTAAALKEKDCVICKSWLENVNRKSSSYAKRISHVITEYRQACGITNEFSITQREKEILTDLSHGLSRSEIAVSRSLSINAVKMVINNLYGKLGAGNLADAIRIATEKKIV